MDEANKKFPPTPEEKAAVESDGPAGEIPLRELLDERAKAFPLTDADVEQEAMEASEAPRPSLAPPADVLDERVPVEQFKKAMEEGMRRAVFTESFVDKTFEAVAAFDPNECGRLAFGVHTQGVLAMNDSSVIDWWRRPLRVIGEEVRKYILADRPRWETAMRRALVPRGSHARRHPKDAAAFLFRCAAVCIVIDPLPEAAQSVE